MREDSDRSRLPRRSRNARWTRAIPSMRLSLQAEAAATASPAAAPVVAPAASLLTGQVLRDGEVVMLVAKPSLWFIPLSSLGWIVALVVACVAARATDQQHIHIWVETALFIGAARIMWAIVNWMGKLYVLTDQRILRASGVFSVDLFECPLRKVARTRLLPTIRERALRLASIEIIPEDDTRPCAFWQTLAKPAEINEKLQRAIRRAKQGGMPW